MKLEHVKLSNFVFSFNVRRYSMEQVWQEISITNGGQGEMGGPATGPPRGANGTGGNGRVLTTYAVHHPDLPTISPPDRTEHIGVPCGIDTTMICLFGRPVQPNHEFDSVRPSRSSVRVLNSVDSCLLVHAEASTSVSSSECQLKENAVRKTLRDGPASGRGGGSGGSGAFGSAMAGIAMGNMASGGAMGTMPSGGTA